MGFGLDDVGDAFESAAGSVGDFLESDVGTVATGGMNKVFTGSFEAAKEVTGINRAQEAEAAAGRLKQAQNRLLQERTMQQRRQQVRKGRLGRAQVQLAAAVSGMGPDSSVAATGISSARAQISGNLASLRRQLDAQFDVAEAQEELQEASQPSTAENIFSVGVSAFTGGLIG